MFFFSATSFLTVAAIAKVCPDDVFLGETEDPQSTSSHGAVYDNACVGHHLSALIETHSETVYTERQLLVPRIHQS